MRRPLSESTNTKSADMVKDKKKDLSDKEKVTNYLQDVSNTTKDYSLKYDIQKCLEIIEGKENQEMVDIKEEFVKIYEENKVLFSQKCDLMVENEYLKYKLKSKK